MKYLLLTLLFLIPNYHTIEKTPIAKVTIYIHDNYTLTSDCVFDPRYFSNKTDVEYRIFEKVVLENDKSTLFLVIDDIKKKQDSVKNIKKF